MKKKGNKTPVKKNLSSTQVLKTLQVLMQGNYSMAELIQKLNENEDEPIFNNSVICKYINTCRYCGITIHKIYNRYFVSKVPFGINISDSENDLIQYLQILANKALSVRLNKKFAQFIMKLSNYSNREITRIENNDINIVSAIFDDAIRARHKILLMLRNKTELECVPLDIQEQEGQLYFHVYHNNKEKMILLNRVLALEVLKERFVPSKKDGNIVFKLTGRLAQNYTLRENETIVENNLPEYVSVANHGENTVLLMSRLLKYGELCELKAPKHIREEFKAMVDETLVNYGEA